MNINATLIVQVINFFIAYLLFRVILLKPAYAVMCHEQELKVSLEQRIAADKSAIEARRRESAQQWHENYLFFQKSIPIAVNQVLLFKGLMPKIKLHPIDPLALNDLKNQMIETIIQSVGVHDDRH